MKILREGPLADENPQSAATPEQSLLCSRRAAIRTMLLGSAAVACGALAGCRSAPSQESQNQPNRYNQIRQALAGDGDLSDLPPYPYELPFESPITAQEWGTASKDERRLILTGIVRDYQTGRVQTPQAFAPASGQTQQAAAQSSADWLETVGRLCAGLPRQDANPLLNTCRGTVPIAVEGITIAAQNNSLGQVQKILETATAALENPKQARETLVRGLQRMRRAEKKKISRGQFIADGYVGIRGALAAADGFFGKHGTTSERVLALLSEIAGAIGYFFMRRARLLQLKEQTPYKMTGLLSADTRTGTSPERAKTLAMRKIQGKLARVEESIAEEAVQDLPPDELAELAREAIAAACSRSTATEHHGTLTPMELGILRKSPTFVSLPADAGITPEIERQISQELAAFSRAQMHLRKQSDVPEQSSTPVEPPPTSPGQGHADSADGHSDDAGHIA